jgi:hypothetical protein
LLEASSARRVASYGVGVGLLELLLHRLTPDREFVVTEYAPHTVKVLGHFFDGVDVQLHDLLRDPPLEADIHVFHRIDTEFRNRNWRRIFQRFEDCEVVLIAAGLVTPREALVGLRASLKPGATRAGTLRTRSALESLWRRTHVATTRCFHDLEGWHLLPKGR